MNVALGPYLASHQLKALKGRNMSGQGEALSPESPLNIEAL